jgi:hypothetical protein
MDLGARSALISIIEVEVRHEHNNNEDSNSGAATYHANGMMQGDPTKVAITHDQQIVFSRKKSAHVVQGGPPGVAGVRS